MWFSTTDVCIHTAETAYSIARVRYLITVVSINYLLIWRRRKKSILHTNITPLCQTRYQSYFCCSIANPYFLVSLYPHLLSIWYITQNLYKRLGNHEVKISQQISIKVSNVMQWYIIPTCSGGDVSPFHVNIQLIILSNSLGEKQKHMTQLSKIPVIIMSLDVAWDWTCTWYIRQLIWGAPW